MPGGIGLNLVTLNGGERDPETNAPVASTFIQTSDDATDESARIPFGTAPLMCALGLVAVPYPPDKRGHAEGIAVENVGGLPARIIAGWDTRGFKIIANAKPGDTILHSTGPSQSAQVQLKEEKRQAVIATTKADGEQILVILDGKNKKVQIAANGAMWEIDAKGSIHASSPNGNNGIDISNDSVHVRGKVILGGKTPNPAQSIMLGPVAGSPAGPAAAALVAAQNVYIGL